jgi:Zn-dependent peptidase ImmA (M78 family)
MRSVDFARMFHGWLGGTVPIAVEELPRRLGIGVRLADLGGCEGSLIVRCGRCLIVLNRRRTLACRRFTLAHEIGHWLYCPHSGFPLRPEPAPCLESELNRFAGELLMPHDTVLSLWELYRANPQNRPALVAERLLVSHSALAIRLRELGIIGDHTARHKSGCHIAPSFA